jgi:hypothetical protein
MSCLEVSFQVFFFFECVCLRKNVYFSNMKKIIKHYPMTGQLIVTQGYVLKLHFHLTTNLNYSKEACKKVEIACMYLDVCGNE